MNTINFQQVAFQQFFQFGKAKVLFVEIPNGIEVFK